MTAAPTAPPPPTAVTAARPTVVLLHGLARTRWSMAGLGRHLERAGFPTWSCTYPSRRLPITAAADEVAACIARALPDALDGGRPLVAVTHSLGGVIARHISARIAFSRMVMLAPPSQGSRVARALRERPLFRWFYGPAGQEIGGPTDGRAWPAPLVPCAVIAGTRARAAANPTSWLTRRGACFAPGEPNDGTLAVAETHLPEMTAFATVDASHTFIMDHPRARELVVRFLEDGALPAFE